MSPAAAVVPSLILLIIFAAGRSIQNEEKVSIKNQMSNRALIVHCRSGDDDLGVHVISVGSDFHWSFKDSMSGKTLFACHLAVQDKRIHFVAYKDEWMFRDTCHWKVDDVGVHSADEGFVYLW